MSRHITLNKGQQQIVDEAVRFHKSSSEQVFQFEGPAGTGKSVVLNAIAERLGMQSNRIAPMSYTGQAATVMRLKGFPNSKTVHSWLYEPVETYLTDKFGNIVYDNYLNRPITTIEFVPKILNDIDIMFIDEGGTTPFSMKSVIEEKNKKIIVAGDLGQLPPVNDKPAYLVDGEIHHLTEIMRQKTNSNILYLADRARHGLPINCGFYGDVLVIEEDDLSDDMILHSDIVVCGTNKTRDYLNKKVRSLLGIRTDIPMQGERVICRKNNWKVECDGINLTNGLSGIVMNSPGIDGFDGKTFKIDFKPNLINGYFNNLRADYDYLIAPWERKKLLKKSKYSQGDKFEFAYAITTHLSQGAQFANGIYISEFLNKDIQNNLDYTGITRFSNSLIYVIKKGRKNFYF